MAASRTRLLTYGLLAAGVTGGAVAALALATAPAAGSAPTCTITWTGATSTDWDTASNWSPARVPTTSDVACMSATATRKTVVSQQERTVRAVSFTVAGSRLTVASGTFTVTDAGGVNGTRVTALTLSGGTLAGAWTVVDLTGTSGALATGASLVTTGTSTVCAVGIDAATWTNTGALSWNSTTCSWSLGDGRLVNAAGATLGVTGNGGGGVSAFGTGGIVNAGTTTATLTAGSTATLNVAFANTGTVNVVRGTLAFAAGGLADTPDTGAWNRTLTGTNVVGTPVWSAGDRVATSVSGSGVRLTGGTATVNGGTLGALELGADLTVPATRTFTVGDLAWTGGTLHGPGTLASTGAGSAASADVTYCVTLADSARWSNTGTVGWNTARCNWAVNAGSRLVNATGGTLAITGDGTGRVYDFGDGTGGIVNAGTTTAALTAPTAIATIGAGFANTGTVTVTAGVLSLTGGGLADTPDTGAWNRTLSGGAVVGTAAWSGGARTSTTVSGTGLRTDGGTATVSGGTLGGLELGGDLTVSASKTFSVGDLAYTGGTLRGPGTLVSTGAGSTIDAAPTYCVTLDDAARWTNTGSVTWNSTRCNWATSADSRFVNAAGGTFAVTGDGTARVYDFGIGTGGIVNAGTTTITLDAATTTANVGIGFANTGTVTGVRGVLALGAGGVADTPDSGAWNRTLNAGVVVGTADWSGGSRTASTISGTGVRTTGGAASVAGGTLGGLEHGGQLTLTTGTTLTVGDLAWNGGVLMGPGTLLTTGTGTISADTSYCVILDGARWSNTGTVSWNTSQCSWGVYQDSRFTNATGGSVVITGDGSNRIYDFGGSSTSAVVNAGTMTVTLTTATAQLALSLPFTDTGTLTVTRGSFTPGPTVTNLAGGTLTGGTWNAPSGTIVLPGSVVVNAATVSIGATGQIVDSTSGGSAFTTLTTNTGSFTLARTLTLTGALTNSGVLTVAAGTLTLPSLTQSAGTTTVAAGATLNAGTAAVRINGGTLTGSGTVRGAVQGAGTVAPGTAGVGTLAVTGTVNTTAGTTLAVTENATAGTAVTASGAVTVTGAKLVVTTVGAPAVGTVRTVVSGSSRTGTVASLTGVDVPAAGGYWVVGYTPTSVTLTLTAYPTVSVANATVAEGNSGTSNLTFTVSLSAASPVAATVAYATSNATAVAGQDYTATSGTVTFAPGATSATAVVTVIGDTLFENDETLTVALSSPTGSSVGGTGSATGTITNDDTAPAFSVADTQGATSAAGGGTATFTISLGAPSGLDASVHYATVDGTALAGTDYTAAAGTVTIPAGQTSATVDVQLTTKTTYAAPKTFTLVLSDPVQATIADGTATATIVNGNPNGPTVASVVPGQAPQGTSVAVTVNGTGFGAGATLGVSGTGVTVTGVTVVDPTTITATFTLTGTATTGARAVTVTSAGLSDTCAGCFSVTPRPTVTAPSRTAYAQGNVDVVLTATGTGFGPGTTLSFVRGTRTIAATSVSVSSPTSLTAVMTVPATAVLGSYNVVVGNPDGGVGTCVNCVTVFAAPKLTAVSPSTVARGASATMTFTGSGFVAGALVSVPGCTLSNVTVVDATTITATVTPNATATSGSRAVKVINPAAAGSGTATKAAAVTVT